MYLLNMISAIRVPVELTPTATMVYVRVGLITLAILT